MDAAISSTATDTLEQILLEAEAAVARLRAIQMAALAQLDARQVATADGCRSMVEWTAGRLDIAPETAAALFRTAVSLLDRPAVRAALDAGDISFDRAVELARFASSGIDPIDEGRRFDITELRRHTARIRRLGGHEERRIFNDRYLVLQPTLDESAWRLHGQLPGADGRIVERALDERADRFPLLPGGTRCSRGQRNADALVSLSTDSLTATGGDGDGSAAPLVTVFVDASTAAAANGEAGAAVAAGPRVGPNTLRELLCEGSVEVTATTENGTPLAIGGRSRVISPRLRRWILHRDGGCTADGCTSRYRLQAHHIRPWSEGGQTDPDNLTTLC